MSKIKKFFGMLLVSVMALSLFSGPVFAASAVVYDATPNPVPPNVASLGYQATSTSEFGDYIHLAGTNRILKTVDLTMSNWALQSTPANVTFCENNPGKCPTGGFTHPITVSLYNVVPGSPNTKGTEVASLTKDVFVPWRPEADPTCSGGTAWRASDGDCYNGYAFNTSFDMSSLKTTLPNDLIVGVAYNTQTYGATPLGVDGPYNSLNVGVASDQTASVGTDDDADKVFWDTIYPGYTAGLKEDSAWAPNGTVNIRVTASAFVPTKIKDCTKKGWKKYTNPKFKSQASCIKYVVYKKYVPKNIKKIVKHSIQHSLPHWLNHPGLNNR